MSLQEQEKVNGNNEEICKKQNNDLNWLIAMKMIEELYEKGVVTVNEFSKANNYVKRLDAAKVQRYSSSKSNKEGKRYE